jgi:hypothetical protein
VKLITSIANLYQAAESALAAANMSAYAIMFSSIIAAVMLSLND